MKNKRKRLAAIFLSLCISATAASTAVAMPVSAAEAAGEIAPLTETVDEVQETAETAEEPAAISEENTPAPAAIVTGWQTVNGKKYYYDSNGNKVTGWQRIDKLYYFDGSGVMATNWQTIGGKTYYFGSDGVLRKGMKEIDGKKYYFETSDGSLSTKKDFITTSSNNTYYLQGDGTVATGIKTINGKTYYFAASGVMQKSKWVTVSGKKYYLKADGMAATGWKKLSGYRYYFGSNGVLDEDVRDRSDVRGISHIVVSLSDCTVTVIGYGTDGVGDIPMAKFVCSPGLPETPTPTGTYYANKYGRWVPLMGPSWGQYGIHVVQGIFFHSVACTYQNVHNVPAYSYSLMGQPASHGCIRMLVGDIKWLYENVGSNTRTVITYSSAKSTVSYFSKPAVPPLRTTNGMNWDPTDPVAQEMFDKASVPNVSGVKNEKSTTDSIKISWKAVSGAEGYDIYRKDNGSWVKIAHTTSLSYTDQDLKAGTKYQYGIKTYKTVNGKTQYSTGYGTVETATNPAKLTGLTVTARYPDYIKLKWNKVDGADAYYVYYRVKGTDTWTRASTTKTSHTFKNLQPGVEYEFAAKGYIKAGGKVYNGTYPVITSKTSKDLAEVSGFHAESTFDTVTLYWNPVANADGYMVYRQKQNSTTLEFQGRTSATSYVDADRASGTVYTYAVKAYKMEDGVEYYGYYPSLTIATKLEKLTGLTADNMGGTTASLSWDAVNGADGYYVYYREAGTKTWLRKSTTNLNYTFTGLQPNTDYEFAAKGWKKVNGAVEVGEYPVITGTTKAEDDFAVYKTTTSVNYRSGAGTSYPVKGTLAAGTAVNVVKDFSQTENGMTWRKVQIGSDFYYMAADYLTQA